MPTPQAKQDCPDLQQYQRLASGLLSDADKEALLRHLEGCDRCAGRLSRLPEQDSLAGILRQAQTVAEGGSRETIAALVERLSKLRPRTAGGQASVAPAAARLFCCPACGKGMKVPDEHAGKQVKCPYCKRVVRVPTAATTAPAGGTADPYATVTTKGPGRLDATVDLHPAREADEKFRAFLAAPQAPDELGRLGPYRVLKVLGSGGMGVVFRAEDPQLMRPVALKAMLPALAASDDARQRFLREARAAAALRHDHIVSVYQVGEDRGVPFLAMEFLEGEPLDVRLEREGKLPAAEVVRVGREIALGLAAAHKRGLVHRDIKPANVWLEAETGRVKILDFGLARAATEGGQLTQLGAVVGTPGYMAPEQAQGKAVDHRCDLFSLGCVLYRLATGRPAFRGTDLVSTLMAVNTHHPSPPHKLDAALPRSLSQLIMKLLTKEPGGRPSSAQEVVEALEGIAREQVAPAPGATPRRRKKGPLLAGAAAGLLLVGVLTLWASGVFKVKTKDGTIVLENLPADATVLVDGGVVQVEWGEGKSARIRVAPGRPHRLQIEKEGLRFFADSVEIDAGGVRTVAIRFEPAEAQAGAPLPRRYTNKMGMEFVLIPRGRAWLGGGGGKPGDREVEILHDFYLGKYEVTQEEWDPDTRGPRRSPTVHVSWDTAQGFVKAVNAREHETGWTYRLPTEAEWEYACRGGPMKDREESAFHFYLEEPSNILMPGQANFLYEGNPNGPCKVGSYPPNRLGLHDMHGNVYEWCQGAVEDDKGALQWEYRGGCWCTDPPYCRAGHRRFDKRSAGYNYLGLRLARVPAGKQIVKFVTPGGARDPRLPSHGSVKGADVPPPSAALEALRRDAVPPEALAAAGGGDANKAPANLVGVLGEAVPVQTARISRLAFSPDGRWLASASFDATVLLRDVSTGRVRRVLRGHNGPVSSVAFSKDGRTLVSAGQDGTLKLWPTAGDAAPQTLLPKCGPLGALAASPDGRFLAAGGKDGTIKLWKWGDWDRPAELPSHPGAVSDLAFGPDGELLAAARIAPSAGADGHIRLYQTADGKAVRAWVADKRKNGVHALAFHPDGKWLASAGQDNHVRLWEVASGKLLGEHGDWTTWSTLAVHPKGETLYACLAGTNGALFDLPAVKPADGRGRKHGFFEYGVVCSAFSPDGKSLAAGTVTGMVHVWDAATWEQRLPRHQHSHYVTSLAVSPDGRTVLTTGDDNTLRRWDIARPRESRLLHGCDRSLGEVAASPDGRRYVTTAAWAYFDAEQRGRVWDAATGEQLFKVDPPTGASFAPVFSPDGKAFAGVSHNSPDIHLWSAGNGRELHRFLKAAGVSPAFNADGKRLATAAGKSLTVWDVASGDALHRWEDDAPVVTLTLSPDGRGVAAGHADGTIGFWDLAGEGRNKRTLAGHTARVTVLRFTPDGRTLISSSDDGTIRLWDPRRERSLREIFELGTTPYPPEYFVGLGPMGQTPNRRLVFELDASGKYLFAAGSSPLIYVLRLP